jgi:plastocyanin
MSNETLFFVFGIALAVSAVATSLIGLRVRSFPGRLMPVVVLWFAILVGCATTFAVRHGKDEDQAHAAVYEQAGKEIEKAESSGPFEAAAAEESAAGSEAGEGAEAEAGGEEGGAGPEAVAKGPGGTVQLSANPTQIAYEQTSLTSKPGKVTIDFNNPSSLEHDVAIEGSDGKQIAVSPIVAKGKTSVSANLPPGTYHFYCTIPGHREAGMEGMLVVK